MKFFLLSFVLGLLSILSLNAQQVLESSELKVEKQFYFVQIKLNGQGPFNFLLDTGAGVTVIRPELAAELGFQATGTARIGTSGRVINSTSYANTVLSIGDYTLATATVEAFSIKHLEEYLDIPLYGIIGSDLIHHHIVELDAEQRKIRFYSSAAVAKDPSWKETDITYLPSGHFGIPVNIQLHKKITAHTFLLKVDSGYDHYVTFSGQAVKQYDMFTQKNYKEAQGFSADTTITTNKSGKAFRIYLAGKTWKRKRVIYSVDPISLAATQKSEDEGIIGNALLMDFNILIDYDAKKMYFQPLNP